MIKAIIFDFDGIIADTEKERFRTLKFLLKGYNLTIRNELFTHFVGRKTELFLREQFPRINNLQLQDITAKRRKCQIDRIKNVKLIDGVRELIKFLHRRYVLAITTGSSKIIVNKILENNRLTNYFSLIIAGEDYKTSKADPGCYILTLQKLKCTSEQAIIIEDSQAGITAGHGAGCKVIALQNQYNKKHILEADKIFRSHKEILMYFKTL